MCLAIPGKVIKIKNSMALVDFSGARKEVNVSLVKVKKGDFVMTHAGFAIEKIGKNQAKKIKSYLN